MNKVSLLLVLFLRFSVEDYPVISTCEQVPHSGIYTLKFSSWTIDVHCDAITDGGGWMTLLIRKGGSFDFYKNWKIYSEQGIGSP